MNYIILAAGLGTRLHPFTKNLPKCMLQLGNGESVIQRMVRLIKKHDSNNIITVVTGFKRDDVEKSLSGCEYIYNPFYTVTNSIASLWFARAKLNTTTIIMNADIVVSEKLFKHMIALPDEDVVFVDSSIKEAGDYNVQIDENHVVVMSKQLDSYHGEYAGITKLTQASAKLLRTEICTIIDEGEINEWYENALVQLILNSEFRLGYNDIADFDWTEIDSVNHLFLARKIQAKDTKTI